MKFGITGAAALVACSLCGPAHAAVFIFTGPASDTPIFTHASKDAPAAGTAGSGTASSAAAGTPAGAAAKPGEAQAVFSAVSEPASYGLLALGLLAVGWRRRDDLAAAP